MEQDWPDETSFTDQQISGVIERLDKLAWKRDWEILSTIFDELDPKTITVMEMISHLRTSFSYRRKFNAAWESFRDRSADELVRRGRNPQTVFRGLWTS